MRKRNIAEDNWEVTLDLEQLDPKMKVADLQEVASRRKVYMALMTASMLTDKGWAMALSISDERHKSYSKLSTLVPNSVLNKAARVSKRIRIAIKRLQNEGL